MLFYLDNFQSVSPNAIAGRRQRDASAEPATATATRHQRKLRARVDGAAHARRRWRLHAKGRAGSSALFYRLDHLSAAVALPRQNAMMGEAGRRNAGTFFFNARVHDDGEKTVLGHKIPAGGGIKDGLMVLDILAHHPSTAKFIATKLVRHFVADNPPPALVDRVAATFTKTDGDIRETLKTIFFSNEFNSTEAYRAKIKRPFELVISAIRTLGADTNGGPGTHQWIERMGEPLYGFQTPNGYSDAAESWVNTGGLLERMNFGLALASNRIPGTSVNLSEAEHGSVESDGRLSEDSFADEISARPGKRC